MLCVLWTFVCSAPQRNWQDAHNLAKKAVQGLSLEDKVTVISGLGWGTACVGNTGKVNVTGYQGLCMQDSPAGIRFADGVSAFPASINVAATFDRNLFETHGRVMGEEFRGKGINVALSPMMNMLRSPQGGRIWEGQGADPYLTAESARLQVRGIQSQGVIATAKHFIGNEQERFRQSSSSQIDDRTLHEFYMQPFEACVEEGVASVMCAYNLVNQTFACDNSPLINDVLKGQLGFKGFVMTDWWATNNTIASANAGSDMMMAGTMEFIGGGNVWSEKLVKAVLENQVPEERVTDAAERVFAAWYKLGQDTDFPDLNLHSFNASKDGNVDVQGNHKEHIRKVGAASSILLKNVGNVLPLKPFQRLAVIGADAGPGKSSNNSCPDQGCHDGTIAMGWGSGTARFPYIITPLDGITQRAKKSQISVVSSLSDYDYEAAAKLAAQADISLVFVAANSGEQYMTVEGNEGDRNNLTLWRNGDDLIETVARHNKRTIVIIHAPGAVQMNAWINNPNVVAVIHALFPGQETGNAIADVLFGDVNPSGRLPFTINTNENDYNAPLMTDPNILPGFSVPQIRYTEGLFVDYRYNDARGIKPLFEFGFGLSYTTFDYSNFRLFLGIERIVEFDIFNTGSVDGHEVAQLYLGFPSEANEPPKQLKDFDRVFVSKKSSRRVRFHISEKKMRIWDVVAQKWTVPKGTFTIYVGSSSRNIKWQQTFLNQ